MEAAMKIEQMKKQYAAPCFDLSMHSSEDVISTSYVLCEEGDGEWLNWADINRAR